MKNMKIALVALLGLFTVTSCNLEKYPDTAINTENAMESVADCQNFRNGLYAGLKGAFTGAFVYAQDLQTDLYHAVKNFGNFDGNFYWYNLTASESVASSAWFGFYASIQNANFLIAGTEKLIAAGTLSAADEAKVKQIYGEACYIRAHLYFNLTQYFCEDYDPETAEEKLGVPVVTVYDPTGDSSKYPARGSLATTYQQIVADLAEAEANVKTAGAPMAAYVTADVVAALQARVALTMHDYDTALLKAKALIDSRKYPLTTDAREFANGWKDDTLKEAIWQIAMTGPDDIGNSFRYFIYNTTGKEGMDNPQYIPEQWVLDLYEQGDIRYNAYFDQRNITTPIVANGMTLLVKYPGNKKLYSAVTNYVNMPKVFRIAEMYLIAAEAAANKSGQDMVANSYLKQLRDARGASHTDKSGADLMKEIREERVRELYGEGFRLNDLKRWHMGFTRGAAQNDEWVMPGENYAKCTRPADDPFFLWPIPTDEVQANPQIEQNPAYTL